MFSAIYVMSNVHCIVDSVHCGDIADCSCVLLSCGSIRRWKCFGIVLSLTPPWPSSVWRSHAQSTVERWCGWRTCPKYSTPILLNNYKSSAWYYSGVPFIIKVVVKEEKVKDVYSETHHRAVGRDVACQVGSQCYLPPNMQLNDVRFNCCQADWYLIYLPRVGRVDTVEGWRGMAAGRCVMPWKSRWQVWIW